MAVEPARAPVSAFLTIPMQRLLVGWFPSLSKFYTFLPFESTIPSMDQLLSSPE